MAKYTKSNNTPVGAHAGTPRQLAMTQRRLAGVPQRLAGALTLNVKSAPYYFLLPLTLVFAAFIVYPILNSFVLSFQELESGIFKFVGIGNYVTLVKDPVFLAALKNTAVYFVIQVPVMVALSLALAVLLDQKFLRGRAFLRMGIFLPSVTALVAYTLVFKLILNYDYGILNFVLSLFKIKPVNWLNTPNGARASVIMAMTWRWTGYNMVIMLAGLQAIPHELRESASLDGAGPWNQFRRITVPMMRPIILFVTITSTIGTFQLFDESYVLTRGGPNNATVTIVHHLYNNGFRYFKFGYAAAISYVLVIIIGALSLIQMKAGGDGANG